MTNAIDVRRSIRSYTGEPVTEEELNQILDAAYKAPIGMGKYDSLMITVITNKEWMTKLEDDTLSDFTRPGKRPFYGAPTLVLLSSTFDVPEKDNQKYSNCAICAEHMALKATEMGIGQVLIWGAVRHLLKRPDLIDELNLPEGFKPCCGVILGHTEEKYEERKPREIKTVYFK